MCWEICKNSVNVFVSSSLNTVPHRGFEATYGKPHGNRNLEHGFIPMYSTPIVVGLVRYICSLGDPLQPRHIKSKLKAGALAEGRAAFGWLLGPSVHTNTRPLFLAGSSGPAVDLHLMNIKRISGSVGRL